MGVDGAAAPPRIMQGFALAAIAGMLRPPMVVRDLIPKPQDFPA